MPSKERVVTTITTELDEKNGKDVVISETVEIQSARRVQTDSISPSNPNTPAAASPSPQKNTSKSKSHLRKKRDMNVPCNQRTLSSFFKPKAEKRRVQNSPAPPSSRTSNSTKQEKTLSPSRNSVSEGLVDISSLKLQKTPSVMPRSSNGAELSSTPKSSSSPSENSERSSHPSFVAPMEEIISIVLGAHDEAAFGTTTSPVTSSSGSRKVRGLDVKAILPSMVVCHDFSQCGDEALPPKHIQARQASNVDTMEEEKCENPSTKRKIVSPLLPSSAVEALSIVASESSDQAIQSKKKMKMSNDKAQLETTKSRLLDSELTENITPTKISTSTEKGISIISPGVEGDAVDTSSAMKEVNVGQVNQLQPRKKNPTEAKDVKSSAMGELNGATVNQLQPRKKNPHGKSMSTNATVSRPVESCATDAVVLKDKNREGIADVAPVDEVGMEVKDVKSSAMSEVNGATVNQLQPRKKNPHGKSMSINATVSRPADSCAMDAVVPKDKNREGTADVAPVDEVGMEVKDVKSSAMVKVNVATVNQLQPRKKNPTEVKDAKSSAMGEVNVATVNQLQPRKKNPTGKSNPIVATVLSSGNPCKLDGKNSAEVSNEVKPCVGSFDEVGKERKDGELTMGEMDVGTINRLPGRKRNLLAKSNSTGATDLSLDKVFPVDASNNEDTHQEVVCVNTNVLDVKDAISAPEIQISPEDSSLLVTYENMRLKYTEKIKELVQRAVHQKIEEEAFQKDVPQIDVGITEVDHITEADDFRDDWLNELSLAVQGRSVFPTTFATYISLCDAR
jgi:hypothetical protein